MEERNMLGMMTMLSSYPVYKATGQTLRLGTGLQPNQYGNTFVWNPSVDMSGFECPEVDPVFIPAASGEADTNEQYRYSYYWVNDYNPEEPVGTGHFVPVTWLCRPNLKDGEAFLDMTGFDMTDYAGDDVGSTPYRIELYDSNNNYAKGFIGAAGTEYTLGEELITGWTEVKEGTWEFATLTTDGKDIDVMEINYPTSGGTAGMCKSNALSLVAGKVYRVYFDATRTSGDARPDVHIGTSTAFSGSGTYRIAYVGYGSNYLEFTATAADVTAGYLWFSLPGNARWTGLAVSMKEKTEPVVTLGGVHIVSADGGSTRNWESIHPSFNVHLIYSYKIYNHDDVGLPAYRLRLQVRDPANNKWARGWIGRVGGSDPYISHLFPVFNITKANPGMMTHAGMPPPAEGQVVYFTGLQQMTELNGRYITVGAEVAEPDGGGWYHNIINTSEFGAAETSDTTNSLLYYNCDETGLNIFNSKTALEATSKGWEEIETGFDLNRTDYEVYITLER